ncbi:MAG: hypothetical protein ABIM40_11520, partial [Pseudomonadota bacterium]
PAPRLREDRLRRDDDLLQGPHSLKYAFPPFFQGRPFSLFDGENLTRYQASRLAIKLDGHATIPKWMAS